LLKELEKTQDLREVNKQLRLLVKYNLGNYVSPKNESLIREDLEQLYRCVDVMAARLEGKGQLPTVPDEPAKPTTPTTRPTTKPTEPPVSSTEPAVSTQPTTEPSKPVAPETTDEPQDTPNNEKRPTGTAKMLGMGMILATLAVAGGTAGFFAIRKGRRK
jgi:outer membrane biosynthesis protein TonB